MFGSQGSKWSLRERTVLHTLYRGNYNEISKQRQNGTCQTFPNTHGNVHGWPPHSYYRENPTTAFSRQNLWAKLFNTQTIEEEHCSQPCRIPTRHGKYTIFPRETVPAGKWETHTYRHRKCVSLPREPVPARKRGINGYRHIYTGN